MDDSLPIRLGVFLRFFAVPPLTGRSDNASGAKSGQNLKFKLEVHVDERLRRVVLTKSTRSQAPQPLAPARSERASDRRSYYYYVVFFSCQCFLPVHMSAEMVFVVYNHLVLVRQRV